MAPVRCFDAFSVEPNGLLVEYYLRYAALLCAQDCSIPLLFTLSLPTPLRRPPYGKGFWGECVSSHESAFRQRGDGGGKGFYRNVLACPDYFTSYYPLWAFLLRLQTVPDELCMDSLCTIKRYEIPILSIVFSVTVQNILSIGYFIPFQHLSVPFPCSITCYSASQSTSVSQLWSSFLLY